MELEKMNAKDNLQKKSSRNTGKKAGLFFLLVILLEIPLSFLIGVLQYRFPKEYAVLISLLFTQGYLLVSAFLYIFGTGTRFCEDLQVRKYRVSTFFLSLLVLLTASPMATWLNMFSQLFVKNQTSEAIFDVTEQVPMWLGVLLIGCLPGFVEETIYRGILFTAFKKRSVLTGILVSAASFGLMHWNFNQMLYAVYLGTIFALLVEATGSLVSSMLLHMLFNTVNTLYIYILPKLIAWMEQYSGTTMDMDMKEIVAQTPTVQMILSSLTALTPFAVGGLILSILLLKVIARKNGRQLTVASICERRDNAEGGDMVSIPLLIGWVICLLICIMDMLV